MKVKDLIEKLSAYDPEEQVAIQNGAGRGSVHFSFYETVTQEDFYGQKPVSRYGRKPDVPVQVTLFLANEYPGNRSNEKIYTNPRTHNYDPLTQVDYVRSLTMQLDPEPWEYTDVVSGKKTRLDFYSKHRDRADWRPRYGFAKEQEAYE